MQELKKLKLVETHTKLILSIIIYDLCLYFIFSYYFVVFRTFLSKLFRLSNTLSRLFRD